MYIRYTAKYFNLQTKREETGVFRAADYVRDFCGIVESQKDELQKLIFWFDENLPVPAFYDDPSKRVAENHTYFWFKMSASEFTERMEVLARILEDNGVKVERLHAEKAAGKLIFEDWCQIAVVPPEHL